MELLNYDEICASIEPENLSRLAELKIFTEIDSTNSYLLEQAKLGAPSGTACFAEQQTRGRGRLGRAWFSPFGANLYFSMLWRFPETALGVSSLGVALAVMVAQVLHKYGIQSGVQLKWPNDVLIAGRKLAGILLESNEPNSVVIGIGLNLDVSTANEKNWIDLLEVTGRPVQRNFLAGLLINELLAKLPNYAERGLRPYLAEWQMHDVLFNQEVVVHTPVQQIKGWMRGISERGELLLENENGLLQPFCYGEVSVRLDPVLGVRD